MSGALLTILVCLKLGALSQCEVLEIAAGGGAKVCEINKAAVIAWAKAGGGTTSLNICDTREK